MVLRARALAPLCRAAGVPFVVNDDVAAARIAGADGVHVGQEDAACADARAELGPDAIVGVSVQTVEQALAAQAAGPTTWAWAPCSARRRSPTPPTWARTASPPSARPSTSPWWPSAA
ncbi:MAG: thiamine phosphate synthase [Gordonibacter pamelaeae]